MIKYFKIAMYKNEKQSQTQNKHTLKKKTKTNRWKQYLLFVGLLLFGTLIFLEFMIRDLVVHIVATNDIHGKAFPTKIMRMDTKQQYNYGGLVYLASFIKIVKSENPGNVLYFDSGDQFQGGIQSSIKVSSGEIITQFFHTVGLNGSAIGNHQFDISPQFLNNFLQHKDSPALAANLKSQKGQKQFLPHQKSSLLFSLQNGIKVGVIGLSTIKSVTTTVAFITRIFPQYQFLPYKPVVIEESQKLRKDGAHLVLIVSHVGNICQMDLSYKKKRVEEENQANCKSDEISNLIDNLPSGTIDGVLQGHRHNMAHYFYKGIPIVGSISGGYYFHILNLQFSYYFGQINLKQASIEGPVPVCQKVFSKTGLCNYVEDISEEKVGQLINNTFHEESIKKDPELSIKYDKWLQKQKPYQQIVTQNEVNLYRQQVNECELINLISSVLNSQISSDIVILNIGLLRDQWYPGKIYVYNVYNMLPFQNKLVTFSLLGKDLLELLKKVQIQNRNFYQGYGLKQTIIVNETDNTVLLKQVQDKDGKPIRTDQKYTILTMDYLLQGGDNFSKAQDILKQVQDKEQHDMLRDKVIEGLKKIKVIKKGDYIDQNNPRLTVSYVN